MRNGACADDGVGISIRTFFARVKLNKRAAGTMKGICLVLKCMSTNSVGLG